MNISALQVDYVPNATASFVSLGNGNYYEPSMANKATSDNATTPKETRVLFQGSFLSDFIIPTSRMRTQREHEGNVAYVNSTFDLTERTSAAPVSSQRSTPRSPVSIPE